MQFEPLPASFHRSQLFLVAHLQEGIYSAGVMLIRLHACTPGMPQCEMSASPEACCMHEHLANHAVLPGCVFDSTQQYSKHAAMQVVMAYAFATALFLGVFWALPNVAWMQWVIVAAVGFSLYGPQMLIGLCGAETVRKPAVSAVQGFLGWISYLGTVLSASRQYVNIPECAHAAMCIKVCALWMERHFCSSDCEIYGDAGAANAGVPLAKLVQTYGWNAYFMALIGACGIILLLLAPMMRLDNFSQRMAKVELKTT